jgi:hypothetical protein
MKVCCCEQQEGKIVRRILLFGLLVGELAACAGCSLCSYRPCLNRYGCEECDVGCGPAYVPRGAYGVPRRAVVCDDDAACCPECGRPNRAACRRGLATCDDVCGDPCTDPCGNACCGRCWHRGPVSWVFALIMRGFCWNSYDGCGCGERYWGDFYSDPPDCWDPCDGHGNYTGGGCRTCGGGGQAGVRSDNGVPMSQDEIVVDDRVVTPGQSAVPHKAVRKQPQPQQQEQPTY